MIINSNHLILTTNIMVVIFFMLSIIVPFISNFFAYKPAAGPFYWEILIKYSLFFNVGCFFLLGFMGHILYGKDIAILLSWDFSPFQYELAFSELALAMLGFMGTLYNKEFWLATINSSVLWLIGASITQLYFHSWEFSFIIYWNIFIAFWLTFIYIMYLEQPTKYIIKQ